MVTERKLTEVHGIGAVRRLQTRNEIRAPIDVVWDTLTQIEHVRHWWADGHIGSRVGERFQLGGEEDLDGTIVTMMKPHIFAFTWHDSLEKAAHPEWIDAATSSLVHFDLIEVAQDTTLLTLIQFSPIAGALGAAAGWHHIFEMLTSYAESGEAVTTPNRFDELKQLYGYS
ncbi:MAG: SRPBCC domain-containing protein [Pseudomonadota bacterium]